MPNDDHTPTYLKKDRVPVTTRGRPQQNIYLAITGVVLDARRGLRQLWTRYTVTRRRTGYRLRAYKNPSATRGGTRTPTTPATHLHPTTMTVTDKTMQTM